MMICAVDWLPNWVSVERLLHKISAIIWNNTKTDIHTSAYTEKSFEDVITYGLCFLFGIGVVLHKIQVTLGVLLLSLTTAPW